MEIESGCADTEDRGTAVYTPAGTGAVATTTQTKLRERVSIQDFGAKGDGVTDDTAAIQAAATYCAANGKVLYVPTPASQYLISLTVTIQSPFGLRSGPGALPIRAKNDARLGLSPDLTGGFRFDPCALADALPLALRPPFGFLPPLRCHAGDLAITSSSLWLPLHYPLGLDKVYLLP